MHTILHVKLESHSLIIDYAVLLTMLTVVLVNLHWICGQLEAKYEEKNY